MNSFAAEGKALRPMVLPAIYVAVTTLCFVTHIAMAAAPIRANRAYEDTVRVLILWNQSGNRFNDGVNVGPQTRDFVINALDTTRVRNVKVVPSVQASWATVRNAWPGLLPHVLIHVNSGYGSLSGSNMQQIMDSAAANHIGIVSIGDDASWYSTNTFGITGVVNVPQPMGGARWTGPNDSLWIALDRAQDDRLKDPTMYPFMNGVISNAVDSLGAGNRLHFKPYCLTNSNTCRHESDADSFTVLYPHKLTFVGYQQGRHNGVLYGVAANKLNVIVAIQDTIYRVPGDLSTILVRRGVLLSFEPQFLVNQTAAEQIVYDAIMYSSLAHKLGASVTSIEIDAQPARDTIVAGTSISYRATVVVDSIDPFGNRHIVRDSVYRVANIYWDVLGGDTAGTGARLLYGRGPRRDNVFTANTAYRSYSIRASIVDGGRIVTKELIVYVVPSNPYALYVENAPDVAQGLDLQRPQPIDTLVMPATAARDSVYAVIRDRFGNFVSLSRNTSWGFIPDSMIISVHGGRAAIGEGVIYKKGPSGFARAWARNLDSTAARFRDTIWVRVDEALYDDLRFVVGSGGQKRVITSLVMNLDADTLLKAEGHRVDGVGGDAFDGWVPINVIWTKSANLLTDTALPGGSVSQWLFSPITNTGSHNIYIRYGATNLRDTLPVTLNPGPPHNLVLYSSAWPTPLFGPSTFTYPWNAGSVNELIARLYDRYGNGLPQYENSSAPIGWEIRNTATGLMVDTSVASTLPLSGAFSTFIPKQAYITLDVIATFNQGGITCRDTVRVTVLPDASSQRLVIEGVVDTTRGNRELQRVDLFGTDTMRTVYAVMRDRFNNFVSRANSALWLSRDTTVVQARAGSEAYIGVIFRRTTAPRNTFVVASQGPYVDSVPVYVSDYTYTRIRIVVNHGGFRDIDTLRQRTDQDTTLYAQGLSFNGQWVPLTVNWSVSSLMGVTPPAAETDRWAFRPTLVDTGWVVIRKGNAADSVLTFFVAGLPAAIVLYPRDVPPGQAGNDPYRTPPATDTLVAGNDTDLVALIFDQYGNWLSNYRVGTAVIRWSLAELSGSGPTGTFGTTVGYKTTFIPTRAGNLVDVVATFSEGGRTFSDAARFYIKPAAPSRLVIEASPNRSASPYADAPIDPITIGSGDTIAYAYAILRDQFGNFVEPCQNTDWSSRSGAIVAVSNGVVTLGEGRIVRQALSGQTGIVARNRAAPSQFDTALVILGEVTYDSVQIAVNHSGLKRIDTLRIRTDQDTLLFAIGKRSDNGQWDAVGVRWTAVGVSATSPAPASADRWNLRPADTDTGLIFIEARGRSGAMIRDTVRALFMPGLPFKLILFPDSTPPNVGSNIPYPTIPLTRVLTAGDTLLASAMVFDHRGLWLSAYKSTAAPITWRIVPAPGSNATGTLIRSSGFLTAYTATRAYHTVDLVAEFSAGGITLRDTVRVAIVPDTATHLVLEGSPDRAVSPNADNPIYSVTLGSRDTVYNEVFAILRDRFGNWVDYSKSTEWISFDTTIARAQEGIAEIGQGWIGRNVWPGVTLVVASSRTNHQFADTIEVIVSNITYDALRIVVNAGGLRDIDTLLMRTDQDTTLFALGLRSDNGKWDNIRVRWGSLGITTSPAPPASSDQWTFRPLSATTGIITATGENGAISDRVVVIFSVGLPQRLVLYPKPGQPDVGDNVAYGAPQVLDTVVAGSRPQLVAKVFDHNGIWLSGYERASAPISWALIERSGNPPTGNLTASSGYLTSFSPRRAYNTVYIIAQFDSGGISFADTVYWYVRPGQPTHLVLEARPDPMASPNSDAPAGIVTISSRDTVANVYAVLRDQFGNYVGFSQATAWQSLDTTVVTAGNGIPSIGEGRIIRNSGGTGQTLVVATSLQYPGFTDTVSVILSPISYDSLRIMVSQTQRIEELVMSTDQDTTLMVQGKRSDNGMWESVKATWQMAQTLRMQPLPPSSAAAWSFTPADTGAGWIRVTLGNDRTTVPDSIRVVVKAGASVRLSIYPLTGVPSADNRPYADPVAPLMLTAGDSIRMVAKLFDRLGIWLGDTAVMWLVEELVGAPPTGRLSDAVGRATTYTADRAFNSVYVIASFTDGPRILLDTVYIGVKPGPAHHVVIEGSQNWQVSPYDDNPLDSITLTSIETYRSVYLVVRDALGNFVGFSQRTSWWSLDTTIASVSDGIASVGEGIVKNQRPNADDITTFIIAESRQYPQLRDTLQVRVLKIYFTALRVVSGDSTIIKSLHMSSNDDTTVRVQGRRSDNGRWIDVQAFWITSPGMPVDPPAPEFEGSWTISPTSPDTGWIVVTLHSDSTVPDTVFTYFRRGDPTRVDFELLTPPERRRAGDTLVAIIRLRNNDGLLPGQYCATSVFQDLFGAGGKTNPPIVIVDDKEGVLNQRPDSSVRMSECFVDGLDTVRFVLYNAPFDKDSLNRLYVRIAGLEGITSPFRLLPADLDAIVLSDAQGRAVGDSVRLYSPSGFLYVTSMGYDRFGNLIGAIPSNWTTMPEGNLKTVRLTRSTRLYLSSAGVEYDERGCILVVASDDPLVRTTVCVTIIAPPAWLVSSITRDINGNGYLDRIDIKFSKLVSFPLDYAWDIEAIVTYGRVRWRIDSIAPLGVRDTVFAIFLVEDTTDEPQTAWTPFISLYRVEAADSVVEDTCLDGAGPVIWKASLEMVDFLRRDLDIVTIEFSEDVQPIGVDVLPSTLFRIWTRNQQWEWEALPHFLDGIGESGTIGFLTTVGSRVLRFVMSNGNTLTSDHYINIIVDTTASGTRRSGVRDRVADGNVPVYDNRRVKIFVLPSKPPSMQAGPNPAVPSSRHVPLSLDYVPDARERIARGEGGTVLAVPFIKIPGSSHEVVNADLRIHDIAGNLVAQASKNDILAEVWQKDKDKEAGGNFMYYIYWSGTNGTGMRVAAGPYRAVLRLDYVGSTVKDKVYVATVGISR